MGFESFSKELAGFIFGLTFEKLPQEVVDRAKSLILDALSVAIAGYDSNHTRIALGLVKNNRGNGTVFLRGLSVPVMDAAFVNSVSTTSIGQDDWASTFWAHPGSVVIPAALAMGEEEGSTGAEVIVAVVIGYEIMGRIFLGASSSIEPRFRSTTVIGPFGAAAAAGKLLRLGEEQLADALGYAANFSSGFRECFITGFMERKFNDAMASRNGVMAALLAKEGAKASRRALEGECGFYRAFTGTSDIAPAATADLGKAFMIMGATYKPYPVDSELQTSVHIALNLAGKCAIKSKEIGKIIHIWPEDEMTSIPSYNNPGPFISRLTAIQSIPFTVAATLVGKPVTDYSFYDHYDDPEVIEVARKVEIVREKEGDSTRIEVILCDGRRYSIVESKTDFLVPTLHRVRAKFCNLSSNVLQDEKREKIIDAVVNLEKIGNIRQLTYELK
jgi:2-methylcitrate dehydratase PrpD